MADEPEELNEPVVDEPAPVVPAYEVGDRVEDQQGEAGTVAEVANIDRGGGAIETSYRIDFDNGSEGWWPEGSLTAEEDVDVEDFDEPDDDEPDDDEPAPAA